MAPELPGGQIDLLGKFSGQVSVTPEEHPDERAVRLRTEERQARIEDWKGVAVFAVLLISVTSVGAASAYVAIIDPSATSDTRRWAQGILTALMSGGISFVVGRRLGSK